MVDVKLANWSHSQKEVRKALKYAESRGFRVEPAVGRRSNKPWGHLRCPFADRSCSKSCNLSIRSTARNEKDHAKDLIRHVDWCLGFDRD